MKLPSWPPRDWRALIALTASIGGAVTLTGCVVWVISIIAEYGRSYPEVRARVVDALANSNYGLLIILGAILLSLGLAINKRSVKASAFGASFDASGGDDSSASATVTTTVQADAKGSGQ